MHSVFRSVPEVVQVLQRRRRSSTLLDSQLPEAAGRQLRVEGNRQLLP